MDDERRFKMRWIVDPGSGLPLLVKAFECPDGPDSTRDPWAHVWCPEIGRRLPYNRTHDGRLAAKQAARNDAMSERKRAEDRYQRIMRDLANR